MGAGSCDAPGDPTLTDLKTRGVRDILICCVDGLTGFPDAIEAIFPNTTVQTCLVHYADLRVMPRSAKDPLRGRVRASVRSA